MDVLEKEEAFEGKRPPVDKVISISYSAFDEFRKRVTENSVYQENSYAYCGIQSEHGTLSLNELKENFIAALETIRKKERLESWKIIMQELIDPARELFCIILLNHIQSIFIICIVILQSIFTNWLQLIRDQKRFPMCLTPSALYGLSAMSW